MEPAATPEAAASGGHSSDHEHSPFHAHHFDTLQQQFDAGKLGMWLFLITEILFFSGLFLAYAVYRGRHPEVFAEAHQYLDRSLGAVNTVVLLLSSLTMAWGVRCAQLSQRRGLIFCLLATLACASLFLGIKAVEYSHKWDLGLFWASRYAPHAAEHGEHGLSSVLVAMSAPAAVALVLLAGWAVAALVRRQRKVFVVVGGLTATAAAFFVGVACALTLPTLLGSESASQHGSPHSDAHEARPAAAAAHEPLDALGPPLGNPVPEAELPDEAASTVEPRADQLLPGSGEPADDVVGEVDHRVSYAGIFFSIYYAMTGVHAVHILAGMGVITWILVRSVRGDFHAGYFGPVDYVGLYWHLVDLVWIYLFPLLYLIH